MLPRYSTRAAVQTALLVLAVFTALYVAIIFLPPPNGFLAVVPFLLLAVAGAVAPAPWLVPVFGEIVVVLALLIEEAFFGGCPPGIPCDPFPLWYNLWLASVVVVLVTSLGAGIRSLIDWRRRANRPKPS